MSERGVFAVDRGIFDHPKLQDTRAPLSKLEAWLWLLASAAWKAHTRRVAGKSFDLQRGQLVASTRYMAERWRWSEPRVRRFLEVLKTDAGGDAEIDAATDAGITVITIRKYDVYQRVSLPSDAPSDAHKDAQTDARATQQRRNKEDKEYREDTSSLRSDVSRAPASVPAVSRETRQADDWPADYREQFWAQYPNRVGKQAAFTALDRIRRARRVAWTALMAGLARYCAKTDDRAWCNPATWINQHRWDDQPAAAAARGPPWHGPSFAEIAENPQRFLHDQPAEQPAFDLDLTAEPGPAIRSGSG
jgi:hypothetical protein